MSEKTPDVPHAPLDENANTAQPYVATPVPGDLKAYQKIGPFGAENLPKGLLKDHRLKAGAWGRLTMLAGKVRFVWSDGRPGNCVEELVAGDVLMVPPLALHNLELCDAQQDGDLSLEIEFLKVP